ncbi:D-glycero-beta-D-manno-heptose 1,7-bisphosphate 7-phosphatase [Orrella sp. 11846]|uniref:D-glycero-beta-D-manno-heptose 1,7-bisphosphate 7-phosphatase n=1 Tax=Orrella sp. 11846 TaxID=3409913 RepID=UPI003B5A4F9F
MKLIILDRDGVINHDSDNYIRHPDEWQPIDGSLEAIARLHQAGWKIVVATNQSGLARGYFDGATLNAMHQKCRQMLYALGGAIDAFFVCPHGPDDHCNCRKPAPGLFQMISERFDRSLAGVPVVGDTLRDLQAGTACGCDPWLVMTGKGERYKDHADLPPQTRQAADLREVVDQILRETSS